MQVERYPANPSVGPLQACKWPRTSINPTCKSWSVVRPWQQAQESARSRRLDMQLQFWKRSTTRACMGFGDGCVTGPLQLERKDRTQ